ncbi:MAG TPA: hypothetical protein DCW74_01270 [Alteromonas australica]|uniref:Major capsid protein n=1 Tax=Alteromonas australica TaxID=589873 RepID=A0A350NZ82_9ALTE|nr:hypothetical protein [Alteromonas australica]|tara:strand:+ start:4906 stop:6312 length:1407 start_codon:yes stop_codon:yes gene_type:complete
MTVSEVTGIAGTSREAFDGLMKDEYGPLWEDHVNKSAKCLALTGLGQVRGRMGGRRQLHAVIDSMPQSAGVAHFEGSTLTDPSTSSSFQPELISRSMYVRLRWTGEVEDAARTGDKAVFAGPRANELRLARQQYAVNKCRNAIFGPRQILGKISSVSGGGPYDLVMEGRNSKTSLAIDYYKMGAHYIRKGMLVDIVTSTAGSPVNAGTTNSGSTVKLKATSVSGNNVTLTNQGAAYDTAPLATNFLVPHGSRRDDLSGITTATDASFYAGYNGLDNLMLDSNLYNSVYGIARGATRPTLDGNRNTNGGTARNFNDLLLILAIDNIVDEGSGDHPDTLYLSSAVRREIVQHLGMGNEYGGSGSQSRRFAPVQTESGYGKLALVAGDKNMTYDTDRDCPPGMVYILRKGTMGYLSNRTLSSIDKAPERYVADKDAHEVIMAERGNFFCTSSWTNGTLEDINFNVSALTTA